MKTIRLACIALAMTPLSLGLGMLTASTPALCAPAAPNDGLPSGAPPLTAAQKQQQQQRIIKYKQDLNALGANASLTPEQKNQQAVALQTTFRQDMLNILTPAQRAAVDAQNSTVLSLRKVFVKQHQSEIDEEQQLGKSLAKSITPAERAKMTSIQQGAIQQIKALEADPKTSPQVKQQTAGAIARDAGRDALAVLTPAQQSMFKRFQALQVKLAGELKTFAAAHHTQ